MHHHNGYDKPFDVWWVCRSCNANIPHLDDYGRRHWANKSKKHAKKFVINKCFKKPLYYFLWRDKQDESCEICGCKGKGVEMIARQLRYRETSLLCHYCDSVI